MLQCITLYYSLCTILMCRNMPACVDSVFAVATGCCKELKDMPTTQHTLPYDNTVFASACRVAREYRPLHLLWWISSTKTSSPKLIWPFHGNRSDTRLPLLWVFLDVVLWSPCNFGICWMNMDVSLNLGRFIICSGHCVSWSSTQLRSCLWSSRGSKGRVDPKTYSKWVHPFMEALTDLKSYMLSFTFFFCIVGDCVI
jgi:hypothetical protein